MEPGSLLILAPQMEHAAPCYDDDAYLEYFMVRSSSFEKVFREQLYENSIMSHFLRSALKSGDHSKIAWLLFDIGEDPDVWRLMEQIKKAMKASLFLPSDQRPYVLFSMIPRRKMPASG